MKNWYIKYSIFKNLTMAEFIKNEDKIGLHQYRQELFMLLVFRKEVL